MLHSGPVVLNPMTKNERVPDGGLTSYCLLLSGAARYSPLPLKRSVEEHLKEMMEDD